MVRGAAKPHSGARGFIALGAMTVVAFVGAALLDGDRDRGAVASVRLDPLPPYAKPAVPPDAYAATIEEGLWRLERVEADDRTLLVRVVEGGCSNFAFMTIDRLAAGTIELSAWNEELRPIREDYGCTLELGLATYRVRLPERLLGRRVQGECRVGDRSPSERQCTALRDASRWYPTPTS